MSKTTSIRRGLLLNITFLIIVLSGSIMITMIVGARSSVQHLSSMVITQAMQQTEQKLRAFIDPVMNELLIAKSWGQSGLLSLDDPAVNERILRPLLDRNTEIAAFILADANNANITYANTNQTTQQMPTTPPTSESWYTGAQERKTWFNNATETLDEQNAIFITSAHKLEPSKEMGITASIEFPDPMGNNCVIAANILMTGMTDFIQNLRPFGTGRVLVLTQERLLIGIPGQQTASIALAGQALDLLPPMQDWPLGQDLKQALQDKQASDPDFSAPVRLISNGQAWWAGLQHYNIAADRKFTMLVMVPEKTLLANIEQNRTIITIITACVLAFGLFRSIALAKRYAKPIENLVADTDRISKGDLEPGKTQDSRITEVQRLVTAHDRMRSGLKTLLKLEKDLQIARMIQQTTLPKYMPKLPGFDLAAWNQPADETGGDTYDAIGFTLDSPESHPELTNETAQRAIFLLADATGHGIGPALSVTQLRAMLRMAVHLSSNISNIAEHINEQLCYDLPSGRFITACLAEVDAATKTLRYISAGQGPLLYFQAKSNKTQVLGADDCPFGIIESMDTTIKNTIKMNPGDIFAIISDGIFEAANENQEQFEVQRVTQIFSQMANASAQQILQKIRQEVQNFTKGIPPQDDQTIILIKAQ